MPDILLPKYSIKFKNPDRVNGLFNPFIGCKDKVDENVNKLLNKYQQKCENIKYAKEYENIQQEALKEGIEIHSNTGFIAQAEILDGIRTNRAGRRIEYTIDSAVNIGIHIRIFESKRRID